LHPLAQLSTRLPSADVVVLATPLTEKTAGLLGEKQLRAMRPGTFLVNAAHAGLIDLAALPGAIAERKLAVAMDLPASAGESGADLAKIPGLVLTSSGRTPGPETEERRWRLLRENVRRFAAGEPLLAVAP
jgi:phosphoglycerate dehydrogenase-like enzyme